MKTEIDRICGIMYTLLGHQPVIDVPYEKINDIAVALVKDGYGKVSEYEAEIEDLKDEIIYLERKIAIRDNALKDRDRAIEMLEGKQDTIVKQAKIDVLNELRDSYGLYYLSAFGVKERMLADILNPMIEELKK